jgi:hypothetical protein
MEKYIILKEENFEKVKLTFEGDLMLFNHYIIKDLNQILDEDKVKYLIKVENEGYYIVVTKDTFHSLIENKFKK